MKLKRVSINFFVNFFRLNIPNKELLIFQSCAFVQAEYGIRAIQFKAAKEKLYLQAKSHRTL